MNERLTRNACRSLAILTLAWIVAALISVRAQADDEPGPEDRARIAEALKRAGYQSFEEVEFDDGVWEVDDAVGSDGREYDLELDPQTLEIIRREAE
jgi:uncharacterized membrane protein YkoI